MTKKTVTILQILQSELIKKGKNEFFTDGQFVLNGADENFIIKAMKYDKDVELITNKTLFVGYTFPNPDMDKWFKKTFINRFLNSEIAFQTLELFNSRLVSYILIHEMEMVQLYDNFEKMLSNDSTTTTKNDSSDTNDSRALESSLPQNNINLNVDDTVLNFGDRNNINRTKGVRNSNGTSNTKRYNPESFKSLQGLFEQYFVEIDKKCFLQIW